MTDTGSAADSSDLNLFATPFNIAATALSAVTLLLALAFFWSGYQEMSLLFVGPQLTILTGLVGATICAGIAVVAWVAAVYMEPGFDE
ncbi:hypothetical protein [Halosolutus halophilus]|uniref:hypothetical protein n=1 Tax=Halosolutus halophilus TaxID=1552990 RepID=UPI0022350C09|nr:hypothetical protein [Halosolutus halophilus]